MAVTSLPQLMPSGAATTCETLGRCLQHSPASWPGHALTRMYRLQLAQRVAVNKPPLAHVATAQVGRVVEANTAALAAVTLHCGFGREQGNKRRQ